MAAITLARHGARDLVAKLHALCVRAGLSNTFNASVARHQGANWIAFRAESRPGEKPFRAYIARIDDGGAPPQLIDLTELAMDAGRAEKVADPKLLTIDEKLYVTYNSGNVHSGFNRLTLQRIHPELGAPQDCRFDERRSVEKNWGFFEHGGQVRAIYSLAPFRVLELTSDNFGQQGDLVFRTRGGASIPARFPRMHIGSQPHRLPDGRLLLVANQQVPIPGVPRKIYFGRLVQVEAGASTLERVSRKILIDSWRNVLPHKIKHNPGLLSATYFAGLSGDASQLRLSYGVNDVTLGIADLPESDLWHRR